MARQVAAMGWAAVGHNAINTDPSRVKPAVTGRFSRFVLLGFERRSGLREGGHFRYRVDNHAAMSEMQICLDAPVSNAELVGVVA
jgi:hypothetical protein